MNLDDALAAWADSVRLPAEAAADIGEHIVAVDSTQPVLVTTPGLPPGWWLQHNKQLADLMIRSTRPIGLMLGV